ncbi:FecR family protein [Bacteriovoracaceae bacterium]|nr:FecR family protein [Bacteriovoracaceae bacterium]
MKYITTLFCLINFLYAGNTFAQEEKAKEFSFDKESNSIVPNYVGKVAVLRGRAYRINEAQKKTTLKKDMKIYKKDIVETTSSTLVKIKMVDNTTLIIGPKSQMKFDHFVYRTKQDRESVLKLINGKMRVHFNIKAPKKDALKVRVKHVSMGVRGTKILATTTQSKDYHQSQILLIEGEGHIIDKHHDHEQVLSPKDHYISSTFKNKKHKKTLINIKNHEHDHYKGKTAADKDFLPLLPFEPIIDHEGKTVTADEVEDEDTSVDFNKMNIYQEEEKPNWKNTLKELNKKLKE